MSRKIIGKDIEPKCQYCLFATLVTDSESVICIKKGMTDTHSSCKKFKYDPLKRIPRALPEMMQFSTSDFSLEEDNNEP